MADEILVGSVAVGIVPSAQGFAENVRKQVVPSASNIGSEWGQRATEGINSKMGDFMARWSTDQSTQAKAAGSDTGATYGQAFRESIAKLMKDLPPAELTANSKQAQDAVAKLRAELEDLHDKEIGVDLTNTQALARIDEISAQLGALTDKPYTVDMTANIEAATADIESLRALASKPIAVPVKVTGEGKAGAETSLEADMATAGDTAAVGFGARFTSRVKSLIGSGSESMATTREGMVEKLRGSGEEAGKEFGGAFSGVLGAVSKVGVPAAIAGALVAVSAVLGERLDMAQKQLEVSLDHSGQSWDAWKDKVTATGAAMTKFGYTQDQVDMSIRSVFQVTGNMSDALKSETVIADIAANTHQSLASATTSYTRALTGNARQLKQLGIVQASGTTETAAMSTATKELASQIQTAGGMAKFAEINHVSLSKAQDLVKAATHGNIDAFNQLGIEVLPKSNTAAENFAETNRVLEARLGGQASAVADSFGGKIANLKAKFEDAAMEVGTHVLPYLETLMDWIITGIPRFEALAGRISNLVKPAVGIFFKGLGDILKFLTSGPMKDITLAVVILTAAVFALNIILAINPFVALGIAIIFIIGLIDKFHNQIIHGIEDAINWVKRIWDDGWNGVKVAFRAVVNYILGSLVEFGHDFEHTWDNIWGFVSGVFKAALNFLNTTNSQILGFIGRTWNSFWGGVTGVASRSWNWLKGGFSQFFHWMSVAWQDAVNAIARIWNTVEAVAKAPVNFIVGTVYNKGIVPVVDAIAGVFGMHPLKAVPGFAKGTGGAPAGWAWVGEQGPELVRMTGGETVLTHAQSMATGLWGHGRGFATGTETATAPPIGRGGVLGAGNPTGDSPINLNPVHWVEKGIAELRDLAGDALAAGMNAVLNPLLDAIPGISNGWGQYVKRDVTSMEARMVDWIKGISNGPGGSASGAAILADAVKYNGHRYVYGGPSNPAQGWDCSSFVSYVLGHDLGMSIPGGSWGRVTNNGNSHGPVASQYKTWTGAKNKGSQDVNRIDAGDLLTWDTHVGFGAGLNRMFSAYDTASGTIYTAADAGPPGEQLIIRVLNAASGGSYSLSSGVVGTEQRYALSQLSKYGWGPGQMQPLILLWNHESGWNADAVNSSSGAYGIPQALGKGHPYNLGDYIAQINWGLSYINGRYGSPAGAWAHEQSFNWYADGTQGARPGWAVVGERGMELVRMNGGETVLNHQQTMTALAGMPVSQGYAGGTVGSGPGKLDQNADLSLKAALRGVEQRLDKLTKTTGRVGSDVASNLNSTGRIAGGRATHNNVR